MRPQNKTKPHPQRVIPSAGPNSPPACVSSRGLQQPCVSVSVCLCACVRVCGLCND